MTISAHISNISETSYAMLCCMNIDNSGTEESSTTRVPAFTI